MAAMALNLPGGSPVAARDTSQTPGHNAMRPQPTETASNGVNINGVDDKGATSPATVTATATPVPELVSQISRTPPQPTSAEPPSAQPTSTGTLPSTGAPLSTQPLPSTGPLPSTQPPPSTQLPSSMPLPSTRPVLAHPHINSTVPVGQPIHSEATHPPDQHRRGPPSTPVSSSGISPQLSQSSQHRKQIRDVNGVPKRFPSPEFDHSPHITGFNRDLSLLADAIQRSCPEAVRQAVRDKWQKCMMGSEFHNAFLVSTLSYMVLSALSFPYSYSCPHASMLFHFFQQQIHLPITSCDESCCTLMQRFVQGHLTSYGALYTDRITDERNHTPREWTHSASRGSRLRPEHGIGG